MIQTVGEDMGEDDRAGTAGPCDVRKPSAQMQAAWINHRGVPARRSDAMESGWERASVGYLNVLR